MECEGLKRNPAVDWLGVWQALRALAYLLIQPRAERACRFGAAALDGEVPYRVKSFLQLKDLTPMPFPMLLRRHRFRSSFYSYPKSVSQLCSFFGLGIPVAWLCRVNPIFVFFRSYRPTFRFEFGGKVG